MLGAVREASNRDDDWCKAVDVLGERFHRIPDWNDQPSRKKHEVIDALMEAAARLRETE